MAIQYQRSRRFPWEMGTAAFAPQQQGGTAPVPEPSSAELFPPGKEYSQAPPNYSPAPNPAYNLPNNQKLPTDLPGTTSWKDPQEFAPNFGEFPQYGQAPDANQFSVSYSKGDPLDSPQPWWGPERHAEFQKDAKEAVSKLPTQMEYRYQRPQEPMVVPPKGPATQAYEELIQKGPRTSKLGTALGMIAGGAAAWVNSGNKGIPKIDMSAAQSRWKYRAPGGGSYDEKVARLKEAAGMEAGDEKRTMEWQKHQSELEKTKSETKANYGRDTYYTELTQIEKKRAINTEEKELFDSTVTPWGVKDTDIIVLQPGDSEPPPSEGYKIVPSPFSRYPNMRYAIRKSLGFEITEEEARGAAAVQYGPDGKPRVKDYRQITEPMRVRLAAADRQLERARKDAQDQIINALNYMRYDLQRSNAAARAGTATAIDARERARILAQALDTKNKGIANARETLDEKLAMYRPDAPEYKRAVRDFKETVTNLLNAYSDVTEKPLEVIGDDLEVHPAPQTGREFRRQVMGEPK